MESMQPTRSIAVPCLGLAALLLACSEDPATKDI